MVIKRFPPVSDADENGLLAIGGDLEVESLLLAYRNGVFIWPVIEGVLTWFAPPKRAVLFLDEFYIPSSLRKLRRKANFSFKINCDFNAVILACAENVNRGRQGGTWITPEVVAAYKALHEAGYAASIECYQDEKLAGGLYGVVINGMFAGESMFYRVSNASKLALCFLVDYLREQGVPWIDCQVLTPLLESFGARELNREDFMETLQQELNRPVKLFAGTNN